MPQQDYQMIFQDPVMSMRKRLIGKTFKNDYTLNILKACRNTGNSEAVGKCADAKLDRSKAHGTGPEEKQVPKLM
jgi:hypothetical protein